MLPIYWRWTPLWTYVPLSTDTLENLKIMIFPALVFRMSRAGPIMRITRSAMLEGATPGLHPHGVGEGLAGAQCHLAARHQKCLDSGGEHYWLQIHFYLGGTVIVLVHLPKLPGMGSFFFEALIRQDFPVVQSINLIVATFALLLNLIVDFSYACLDPRIRYR